MKIDAGDLFTLAVLGGLGYLAWQVYLWWKDAGKLRFPGLGLIDPSELPTIDQLPIDLREPFAGAPADPNYRTPGDKWQQGGLLALMTCYPFNRFAPHAQQMRDLYAITGNPFGVMY